MVDLKIINNVRENTANTFNNTNENKKKKWFNNLINELEECNAISRLQDKWNSMKEEQKAKLYNNSATTVSWMIVRSNGLYWLYRLSKSNVNRVRHTIKNWFKNALKYDLLEQIPCRFLVQLWILQKPEWITKDKLVDDIKKDADNFHTYLWICKWICSCFKEATPVIPYIETAKTYTQRYKDHWTEIITDRLNKNKKLNIKTQTNKELSDTFTSEKTWKKAA